MNRNRDESDFKKALDVLHIAYTVISCSNSIFGKYDLVLDTFRSTVLLNGYNYDGVGVLKTGQRPALGNESVS